MSSLFYNYFKTFTLFSLLLPSILIAVSVFSLAFQLPIKASSYYLSFALALLSSLGAPARHWKLDLVYATLTVVIFATIIFSCLQFNDLQWDSRDYQLPAAILISEGWNPLYTPFPEDTTIANSQITLFPKGAWYIGAASIQAFNSLEAGKFINFLFLAAAFIVAYLSLENEIKRSKVIVTWLAAIAALNPITLFQLQLHYVDGAVASLVTILIFSLLRLVRGPNRFFCVCALLSTFLLISLKTSGAVFAAIFWLIFLIFQIKKISLTKYWVKKLSVLSIVAIVINFNPLITNYLEKGSPLYPFVAFGDTPKPNFLQRGYYSSANRFERAFIAYSSAPSFIDAEETDMWETWKSPFRMSNLISFFLIPELARTNGGFGPLFGYMLFFTLPLAFIIRTRYLVIILSIAIGAFIHTEGWHARYTPFVWLAPLFIAIGLQRNSCLKRLTFMPWIVCATLSLNLILMYFNLSWLWAQQAEFNVYLEDVNRASASMQLIPSNLIAQNIPYTTLKKVGSPDQLERFLYTERTRLRLRGHATDNGSVREYSAIEFLDLATQGLLVIAVKDEATSSLSEDVLLALKEMGSRIDELGYRGSYAAITANGRVFQEAISSHESVSVSANLKDSKIEVFSAGFRAGNRASIAIDGREFSLNLRGLNLVFISPEGLVHSAVFDTFESSTETVLPNTNSIFPITIPPEIVN